MNAGSESAYASGFCLKITRKRLRWLGYAALYLIIGFLVGLYGCILLQEDKTGWDSMEYIKLVVGLIAAFIFLSLGIYTVYTSIRDAFWPEKSTLARSIRGQLPYPDSTPKVKELFAMVDKDIGINGQWFDQIAVGKEWVLGEVASYLPRIQVFFGRDETRTRKSGNHC